MSVRRIDGIATATCGVCGQTYEGPNGDFNTALRILILHLRAQHEIGGTI